VALDTQTLGLLAELKGRRERPAPGVRVIVRDEACVFCQPDGSFLHPDRITKVWRTLVKDSGLPPIKLHGLRHTHATIGLASGLHPLVMAKRLGHSRVSMTLDTYSDVIPQIEEDAAETMATAVFGERSVDQGASLEPW
jgi:integrase